MTTQLKSINGKMQGIFLSVVRTPCRKTSTQYSGLDPEATIGVSAWDNDLSGVRLDTGQDDGTTPMPIVVQTGLQIKF